MPHSPLKRDANMIISDTVKEIVSLKKERRKKEIKLEKVKAEVSKEEMLAECRARTEEKKIKLIQMKEKMRMK